MLDSEHNRNDWCPVSERLPEDNEPVFVRTEKDKVGIGHMETKGGKRIWIFSMKNEFPPRGSKLVEWKSRNY